jgi:transposase InsO family protein
MSQLQCTEIKKRKRRGCNEPDCVSSAQGKTDKCKRHGGGKRCPNCIDWIDSRSGSTSYDGYCATCFKQIFPDDIRSRRIYVHTKEIMVRNRINEEFEGFIHNTSLYTGNCDCTHRRRIDHRKMIGNTILAIETDEFGHRGYDKADEEIRYDDVYMIHSGKWIFIRFNPDTNVSKIDIEDKLDKLIETMKENIVRIECGENTEFLEIIKLYC